MQTQTMKLRELTIRYAVRRDHDGAPVIVGGSAKVNVELESRSGLTRVPVTSRGYELTLTLGSGRWVVTSAKLVSTS